MVKFHYVHAAEFLLCYFVIAVTALHEYYLRYYVGRGTFAGLPRYHRFFFTCAVINTGLLFSNRTLLSNDATSGLLLFFGLIPAVVVSFIRKRWIAACYLSLLCTFVCFKAFFEKVYGIGSIDVNTGGGAGFKKRIHSMFERLMPMSFFVPCLHPESARIFRHCTAPLWHLIAFLLIAEMEVLYRILFEMVEGYTEGRRNISLGTETLACMVLLSAFWELSL
eukprot:PhF_6_TR4024/c0_g1_i1/m.5535